MPRIFLSIILFASLNGRAFCQAGDYSNELLKYEEKIFLCANDSVKNGLICAKFNYELSENDLGSQTFKDCIRVDSKLISDTGVKKDFLWNAALISYINDQRDHTSSYLEALKRADTIPDINVVILDLLNEYKYDTSSAAKKITELKKLDSSFACLSCLLTTDAYLKKHRMLYVYASALIPGSGNLMMGNIGKGLTSTFLTGLTAYFAVYLWQNNLYINSIGLAGTLFVKFYFGNIKLTDVEFNKKQSYKKRKMADACEKNLALLLEKYPLEFQKPRPKE